MWVVILVAGLLASACGSQDTISTSSEPSIVVTTSPPATTASSTTSTMPDTSTSVASSSTTVPGSQPAQVFFATGDGSDCAAVTGFDRLIPATDQVAAALSLLVAGPNMEEVAMGASSFFSAESEGVLRAMSQVNGELVVDFRDMRGLLSNASTSCGSESLLAQLNATVFQFEEVERVRYEIDGSCDVFSNWLQRECREYTRSGAEPVTLSTNERALGSGCTPGTEQLPDGRWFGFAVDANGDELVFDLACWFSGTAAADAATEDGEESPPPNDYHIRNQSDVLRTLAVAESTSVTWLPTGDPADATTGSYAQWVAERPSREYLPGVWLEVDGGEVTMIDEQYVP